jgi:hypothetical protein
MAKDIVLGFITVKRDFRNSEIDSEVSGLACRALMVATLR